MPTDRPRLLDAFCGAGGSSAGFARAGFDVTGVDHVFQPRYPFRFVLGDALEYVATHGREYDVIAASPPCQAYSLANNIHGRQDHPRLLEATRDALVATGRPYVIENVPGAPLRFPVLVCGLALGLNVRRHRLFESNVLLFGTTCPRGHRQKYLIVFGGAVEERGHQIGRTAKNGPIMRRRRLGVEEGGKAMGIDWMTRGELSQAIPPAYTRHVGLQLLNVLGVTRADD